MGSVRGVAQFGFGALAADGGAVEDQFDDAAVFGVDVASPVRRIRAAFVRPNGQGGVDEFGGPSERQGEQFVQFLRGRW